MSRGFTRRAFLGAAFATAASPLLAAGRLEKWTKGAAPALALKDERRIEHSLAALAGKAVLVNFWATWCKPCRDEMPSMVRLAERLAGKPFAILAVNVGESEAAANRFFGAVSLDASRLTILYDRDMAVTRRWGATILPASYLVDARGQIRQWMRGEADWTSPPFAAAVDALLPR